MIDFQLFILGLIGLYLLVKSPKKGVLFSLAMIVAGYSSLGFFMNKYSVQPHFVHPSACIRFVIHVLVIYVLVICVPVSILFCFSCRKILDMLRYVHFNFHTYLPMYFTGKNSIRFSDERFLEWKINHQ